MLVVWQIYDMSILPVDGSTSANKRNLGLEFHESFLLVKIQIWVAQPPLVQEERLQLFEFSLIKLRYLPIISAPSAVLGGSPHPVTSGHCPHLSHL